MYRDCLFCWDSLLTPYWYLLDLVWPFVNQHIVLLSLISKLIYQTLNVIFFSFKFWLHYILHSQKQPILTMEPGEGVIYSTKWSPSRPSLFAATTATGLLLLYDLTQSQPVPMYKLEAGTQTGNTRAPVLTCQFNPHQWVQLYILSLLINILAFQNPYRPKWVFNWYFVVLIFWMDLNNNS